MGVDCNSSGRCAPKPYNTSKFGPVMAAPPPPHLRKNVVETSKPDPSVERFPVKIVFQDSVIHPTQLTCRSKLSGGSPTAGWGDKNGAQVIRCKSALYIAERRTSSPSPSCLRRSVA